jgi:dephospho-CoA kinase
VKLGKLVFSDADARAKLNSIVHPLVEKSMKEWLEQPHEGVPVVVIPLLFELGWEERYDCVVTLVSDKKLQVQRLMEIRGCTEAEADARLASQLPAAYKADRSHIVVNNNGSAEALRSEAERVHSLLKKRYE